MALTIPNLEIILLPCLQITERYNDEVPCKGVSNAYTETLAGAAAVSVGSRHIWQGGRAAVHRSTAEQPVSEIGRARSQPCYAKSQDLCLDSLDISLSIFGYI